MSPAISKAKTATFDFFIGFGFGAPEAKLFDIAVFTFISQVSRAMMNYESYVIVQKESNWVVSLEEEEEEEEVGGVVFVGFEGLMREIIEEWEFAEIRIEVV